MQVSDDLFDDKIKERLKNEINYIPEDVNKKINDAVKKIEKRRFNVKKVGSICVICVTATIILGIAMPAYASNIPIIGSILKMFNYKTYENYDKYASDLNITKESNGLKITINKVVYDGLEIYIFYTGESEERMEHSPSFDEAELKINGKKTSFASGGTGNFIDDNKTYVGMEHYSVVMNNIVPEDIQNKKNYGGYIEIPDKFILSLNIDKMQYSENNYIKGKWDFNIPVSSEKVNGNVNEQECNIDLSNIGSENHINKIITTPINTEIQGTKTYDQENSNEDLYFVVFDDKGRYIESKSSESQGYIDDDGNHIKYFNNRFKEVYDDTESLTFIPYKYIFNNDDDTEKEITAKLNLQGETRLYSDDGKEYATITRIETKNGKTKIYYKSKYGVHVAPIEITNNKTNEKILSIDNSDDRVYRKQEEESTYISNSDEYVITCDKVITEGDYSVRAKDQSKAIEVYNDDKFTIKVK
ncbi:hypothetical protein psyc5s11_37200 [Clostridium gelidum]|uniref:DUF4179 domain-containing protein n=2 Tax=Clostridium gelidum TaxID=704125 RepID=A0ABN6J1M1_9CLOT|nr:hypothetical protein psyc5s11_37200 [Clostridium gelidum]